jgi:hypothetical protein
MRFVICSNPYDESDWYLEVYASETDNSPIAIGQFKTWAEAFRFKLRLQGGVA